MRVDNATTIPVAGDDAAEAQGANQQGARHEATDLPYTAADVIAVQAADDGAEQRDDPHAATNREPESLTTETATVSDQEESDEAARRASHRARGERRRAGRRRARRVARNTSERLKTEFEQSLTSCLLFNVLYMYYMDHQLRVLFIRVLQVIRLVYLPYEPVETRRSTIFLLFISNIPVLLIHAGIYAAGQAGDMLLINFVGPEPYGIAKILYVDVVVIILQAILTSSGTGDFHVVTQYPRLSRYSWPGSRTPIPEHASQTTDNEALQNAHPGSETEPVPTDGATEAREDAT